MNVGALRLFRDFSRRRIPGWLTGLLVLVWAVLEFRDPGGDWSDDALDATERTADVGMTLERELGDRAALLEWVLAVDEGPRARDWLADELDRRQLADDTGSDEILRALDGEADSGSDLLARLVASGRKPTRRQWQRLGEDYEDVELWEWEAQAFERLRDPLEPSWVTRGLAERESTRRWIVGWTVGATVATLLGAFAGLVFLPGLLRSAAENPPAPRLMRFWPVAWVVFSFVVVELVSDLVFSRLNEISYWFENWPFALDVLLDAAWRIGGMLALLWLMFPRVRHGGRVLGFGRPFQARPTLATLSLLLLATTLWYRKAFDWFPEDASLDLWEDGWSGLFYAILSGVILAPVCEEVVFRGLLFGGLWGRLGFWPAALLSSALFALVHHYGVPGTVGVFGIGLAGCVLFRRTGSLTGPILVHAAYNGLITLSVWPVYHAPYS